MEMASCLEQDLVIGKYRLFDVRFLSLFRKEELAVGKYIMVACDLHDETMLLKIAAGRGKADKRTFQNSPSGRKAMLAELKSRSKAAGRAKVVFAYEASALGFGLHDEITAAGLECHVLAPTRIARSPRQRRSKCDEKDADRILELLRGYVLAGNDLPSVWIPDRETRDDREIVRARLSLTKKLTALKTQTRTLLKRCAVEQPSSLDKHWTNRFHAWLQGLAGPRSTLAYGARVALGTLLRQMDTVEKEIDTLDKEIQGMAETARYAMPAHKMTEEPGVGLFTAMVFLTEMGDMSRFSNRKRVGSYLGLSPASHDTGEGSDRKGHITHQGSWRVRRALCQASWVRVRYDPGEGAFYKRLVKRNPKRKKTALVACMRRLAVRLWHIGLEEQQRADCFDKTASRAAV